MISHLKLRVISRSVFYDFHILTSKEGTIITYKPSIEKKYLGLKTQGHNFASENKNVVTINQYFFQDHQNYNPSTIF